MENLSVEELKAKIIRDLENGPEEHSNLPKEVTGDWYTVNDCRYWHTGLLGHRMPGQ